MVPKPGNTIYQFRKFIELEAIIRVNLGKGDLHNKWNLIVELEYYEVESIVIHPAAYTKPHNAARDP